MKLLVVAALLIAACRGGKTAARKDAGPHGSAPLVSDVVVPKLPRSDDGSAALDALHRRIEQLATNDGRQSDRDLLRSVALRLERAAIRGRLDDYRRALADSATLVAELRENPEAWQLRIQALLRVHEFSAAREALKQLGKLVHPSHLVEHEITLAESCGDAERALAMRGELAERTQSPMHLTAWAVTLAQAGRADQAIAVIPKAAAAVRDNPPQLIAWLLFQWGRIYELGGEHATARQFFAASHARMPGYVEATTHLAQTMITTGDRAAAKRLVDEALARDRHPELLALAVELGETELAEEARATWERYVEALPLAFADHAARFYLGVGKNPARALELARINQNNRDTREARALVAEAALAAGDAAAACAVIDPLVSGGTRAQRFIAWTALARCGRTDAADRVGRELGIVQ